LLALVIILSIAKPEIYIVPDDYEGEVIVVFQMDLRKKYFPNHSQLLYQFQNTAHAS
jgi:hypothetical protein